MRIVEFMLINFNSLTEPLNRLISAPQAVSRFKTISETARDRIRRVMNTEIEKREIFIQKMIFLFQFQEFVFTYTHSHACLISYDVVDDARRSLSRRTEATHKFAVEKLNFRFHMWDAFMGAVNLRSDANPCLHFWMHRKAKRVVNKAGRERKKNKKKSRGNIYFLPHIHSSASRVGRAISDEIEKFKCFAQWNVSSNRKTVFCVWKYPRRWSG